MNDADHASEWLRSHSGWAFGLVGILVGVTGLVFAVWAYLDTKPVGRVMFAKKSSIVFSPPNNFAASVSIADTEPITDSDRVYETTMTIWNDGNLSIEANDIRVPLEISIGSPLSIAYAAVLETKSNVSSNFSIQKSEAGEVIVGWKIFDPGMALSVVIAHKGSPDTLTLGGDFGPGFVISSYDRRQPSWLLFGALGGMMLATLVAVTVGVSRRARLLALLAQLVATILASLLVLQLLPGFDLRAGPPIPIDSEAD